MIVHVQNGILFKKKLSVFGHLLERTTLSIHPSHCIATRDRTYVAVTCALRILPISIFQIFVVWNFKRYTLDTNNLKEIQKKCWRNWYIRHTCIYGNLFSLTACILLFHILLYKYGIVIYRTAQEIVNHIFIITHGQIEKSIRFYCIGWRWRCIKYIYYTDAIKCKWLVCVCVSMCEFVSHCCSTLENRRQIRLLFCNLVWNQ